MHVMGAEAGAEGSQAVARVVAVDASGREGLQASAMGVSAERRQSPVPRVSLDLRLSALGVGRQFTSASD